ncbi:cytochrome c oxidase subunit II [Pseudofulvibacter geojedonensis]|uniref:cytochrome-c oxidase n=1 Tax=Pseudofulvibacter geojedonensis TaxID=1123758 RepID=A0ABW3I1J1_9FLAO
MTAFLNIVVVLLVAISLWQLSKVLKIYKASKNDTLQANDEDNKTQGNLMLGFLIFLFVFVVYGLFKWGHLVLSHPASEHGVMVDNLMNISWVVIFAVFFLTQFLLHYFAFKYQGKEGQKALYFSDSNKLELIWTIIPVITLAGLILYGLYGWNQIMSFDFEGEEEPLVVELYAQQFSWTARYGGADNTLGDANVRLINADKVNVLGLDTSDPNYADDVIVKEIHLPVGRKVWFKMRSQDVLHSAYMPHFRAQMNCVPGMVTEFAFTPTITTEEMREMPHIINKVANINELRAKRRAAGEELDDYTFDYLLICNKICGKSHYNMQLKIVVDTPEEYEAWMKQQKTAKEVILK